MQLSNLVLRLGGSQLHTVPIMDATPAEILVLQRVHGPDAVVDVRPTRIDKNRRHASEFERLAFKYDRASTFASEPGEESKSIMGSLFPGAMKKLPLTLEEIGLGHLMTPASIEAADRAFTAKPDLIEGEDAELNPAEDEADEVDVEAPEPEPEPEPAAFGGFGAGNLAT